MHTVGRVTMFTCVPARRSPSAGLVGKAGQDAGPRPVIKDSRTGVDVLDETRSTQFGIERVESSAIGVVGFGGLSAQRCSNQTDPRVNW